MEQVRNIKFKITISKGNVQLFESDKIISVSVEKPYCDGGFAIGEVMGDILTFEARSKYSIPKNAVIIPSVDIGHGFIQLGRFICDKSSVNKGVLSVTALDGLSILDTPCKFTGRSSSEISPLSFPATHQQIWDYICAIKNILSTYNCADFSVEKKPIIDENKYYTFREILGFIAAANAGNVKLDSGGKMYVKTISVPKEEVDELNCFDMAVDDAEDFKIKGVLFINGDTEIYIDDNPNAEFDSENSEGVVMCESAFASVAMAESVWSKIGNFTYCSGGYKRRAGASLFAGDVVEIKTSENKLCRFLLTNIKYKFDENGFNEEIESVAETASGGSGRSGGTSGGGGSGGTGGGTVTIGIEGVHEGATYLVPQNKHDVAPIMAEIMANKNILEVIFLADDTVTDDSDATYYGFWNTPTFTINRYIKITANGDIILQISNLVIAYPCEIRNIAGLNTSVKINIANLNNDISDDRAINCFYGVSFLMEKCAIQWIQGNDTNIDIIIKKCYLNQSPSFTNCRNIILEDCNSWGNAIINDSYNVKIIDGNHNAIRITRAKYVNISNVPVVNLISLTDVEKSVISNNGSNGNTTDCAIDVNNPNVTMYSCDISNNRTSTIRLFNNARVASIRYNTCESIQFWTTTTLYNIDVIGNFSKTETPLTILNRGATLMYFKVIGNENDEIINAGG